MNFKNVNIKFKLASILIVFLMGSVFSAFNSLEKTRDGLIENIKFNSNNLIEMAKSQGIFYVKEYKSGVYSKSEAKQYYLKVLENFSYGSETVFAYDSKGVRYVNGKQKEGIGRNFYNSINSEGRSPIKELIEKAVSGDETPLQYAWNDHGKSAQKITYVRYIKEFDLIIGTGGGYLDKVDFIYYKLRNSLLFMTSIFSLIMIVSLFVVGFSITEPVKQIVKIINNMEHDNYNDVIDIDRKDEMGLINKGLDAFRGSLLNSKALEEQQRLMEKEQLEKATFVGETTKSVSKAAFEIEDHITGISSSAAELSSTLKDISKKVDDTSEMTNLAENEAEKGTETIMGLNKISENIGEVVKLIQEIADKTNLLALNASIEAARAGDEGRGFAVVAEEVKKLAQQTRESTNSIADQIKQIQTGSSQSVKAIENITSQIVSINNFAKELVISIEEQKEATNDISERMVQASDGSKFVADKMKEIISKI